MDNPNPILTVSADPSGLTAATSKKLRAAVATVEHHLGPWQPFIAAATTHPLHITVTTIDDRDGETVTTVSAYFDTDQMSLHLRVVLSLLQEPPNRLAARILDSAVPALVSHAEHLPHPEPPAFWKRPQGWRPPTEDPEPGIQLEDLLDGDVLLIARHDGAPADADSREHTLDDYLCERLESAGIAAPDSALTTGTTASWSLELLHRE